MRVRFVRDDGEKLSFDWSTGLVDQSTDDWFPAKTLRTSMFTYAGADGGQMVKQNYDPWAITFAGYIKMGNPANVMNARTKLMRFFVKGHYFNAIFTDCTGSDSVALNGWLSTAPSVVFRGKLDSQPTFSLALTFGDPYLYEYAEDEDGNQIYANVITVPKYEPETESGYCYSGAGYIYYGGGYTYMGGVNPIPTITVDSIQPVNPVWRVTGQATNPSITNLTTNTELAYTGTIAAGQTLVVDSLNRTAMIGTADVSRYLTGDWLSLQVGTNQLRYDTDSDSDTGECTLEWNGVVQ